MGDRRGEAIGTLEFVARSPSRVLILETLAEDGVASRESLAAEVEVVRTTLHRSLQGLADRGLIRERERQYELTSAGALVTSGLSAALERVDAATRLEPVLEQLPAEQFPFDIDRLVDATVVEATTANPYAPVERHAASLVDAEHARLLLPAVGATPLETTQQAIDAGATFELVVTESVAETLRTSPPIADAFDAIADGDDLSVSVVADGLEWYLGIIDDTVQIGVHDENGVPAALLTSTDDRLREWAIDRFDTVQRRASAFELEQ